MEPITGPHSRPWFKTRPDGWPLCPVCGEDELWSGFMWDGNDPKPPMSAWIDHGMRCYRCNWDSRGASPPDCPMPDHYPWYDTSDRAAFLADIARVLTLVPPAYPPGGTPQAPAPSLPTPPPTRFVKFGGYFVCSRCHYTQEFCGCAKPANPSPSPSGSDGAESSLERRARDVKGTP